MTQVFSSPDEAAKHIAPAIVVMLKAIPSLPKGHEVYFKRCLTWMIREMPVYPTKASKAAIEKAKELGFSTLAGLKWNDQKKYDKDRAVLHWEHVVPVGDIRAKLLALESPTEEQVVAILQAYLVAWITKEEDKRLPRTKRADPLECYRKAGIELLDLG